MNKKIFSHFLFVLTITVSSGFIIAGCSSSTTTPPTTTQGNVSPKTGSTYSYAMHKDTAGTKVPNSDTTFTATVTADNMQFFGQSSVYMVIDDGDTTYLTYASNKDVMVYYQTSGLTGIFQSIGDAVFHRWINLGISSKTTGVKVLDTALNVMVGGFSVPAKVTLISDYIGDTTVTVGTEALVTNHCRVTATAVSNTPLLTPAVTYINQRDIYFSTKTGYAAEITTREVIPSIALAQVKGSTTGTFKVLTSYSIK